MCYDKMIQKNQNKTEQKNKRKKHQVQSRMDLTEQSEKLEKPKYGCFFTYLKNKKTSKAT